jgi:hypothetical protein
LARPLRRLGVVQAAATSGILLSASAAGFGFCFQEVGFRESLGDQDIRGLIAGCVRQETQKRKAGNAESCGDSANALRAGCCQYLSTNACMFHMHESGTRNPRRKLGDARPLLLFVVRSLFSGRFVRINDVGVNAFFFLFH